MRSERAKKRQDLGTLRNLRVRSNTRKRYAQAYARFCQHVLTFALALQTFFDIDAACAHYIEHLWHEGEPRLWCGDVLASIHHYVPSAKRQLPISWSLHRAWGKSELPARACPITLPVLHGICGVLISWGFWRDALCALCAYDLVLRTGEMLELRGADIEAAANKATLIVRLRNTKVGQRKGANEGVVVDDPLIRECLRLLSRDLEAGDRLIGCQEHHWRYRWNAAVRALGLSRLDVRAYSLRRGGATWLFRKSGSFDKCLDRGRWGNSRNARTYIEDAAAMAASLRLSDNEERSLEAFAQRLFNWLRLYIDDQSIRQSDHFSSAATATKSPSALPTEVATRPSAACRKKRPASDLAPKPPSTPRAQKALTDRGPSKPQTRCRNLERGAKTSSEVPSDSLQRVFRALQRKVLRKQ